MNVDEIDGAAGAVAEEPGKVGQTEGGAAVGDGGGAEEGLAGERLHVLLVCADSGIDAHAGGADEADIWLVEGHESCSASVDGGLSSGGPGAE